MTPPAVRVSPDPETLARAAAEEVVRRAEVAVRSRGRFALVLSGGSTPLRLYRLLADRAEAFRDRLPWRELHVFFGDERCVPPEHPESNYRSAREALLDHVPVPAEQVHRMEGEAVPEDAAARYEAELRDALPGPWPRLDLVLLGMGADGHTASLFPGSAALEERERAVVAVRAAVTPAQRLTLTFPVLDAARAVLFLVAGADKAARVAEALGGGSALPAARVRPRGGELIWMLDAAAAGRLVTPPAARR